MIEFANSKATESRPRLRVLYATAEAHPTYRPDVRVLFGHSLPEAGVDVDLVTVVEGVRAIPPWTGGRAFLRSASSRLRVMVADFAQQLSLFRRVRCGYDALIVRDKPILGAIGWAAARLAGVPYCYWMSYPLPEHHLWLSRQADGRIGAMRRFWLGLRGRLGMLVLQRLLVPRSDWLFVQTVAMEAALRQGSLRHDRVTAVPMGVDAERIPPASDALPQALRNRRMAVYLGTLDRYRRPELLVEAARIVAERVPDFTMLIIGEADEPTDVGWLPRYATETGADHCVHFTGRLGPVDALALARHGSVGVSQVPRSPFTEVGSPTKAVEYLACGLPVVCNDQPDQAHVVRESGGGWLCEFSAQGIATAILEALADPEEARRRAESGRRWVTRHRSYRVLGALVADRLADLVAGDHVSRRFTAVGVAVRDRPARQTAPGSVPVTGPITDRAPSRSHPTSPRQR
jgi:glycosyltransferase involved in cell wall biosynthesis